LGSDAWVAASVRDHRSANKLCKLPGTLAMESYTNHAIFANLLAYELLMASVVDARRDVEVLQRRPG